MCLCCSVFYFKYVFVEYFHIKQSVLKHITSNNSLQPGHNETSAIIHQRTVRWEPLMWALAQNHHRTRPHTSCISRGGPLQQMLLKKDFLFSHLPAFPGRMLLSKHTNIQGCGEVWQVRSSGPPSRNSLWKLELVQRTHIGRQASVSGQVCEERTAARRGVNGQVFH